jgi:hypothetical protein
MNGEDLVERILAMSGEEADEGAAARRKARLLASIATLKIDSVERARIDVIAARAGMAHRLDEEPSGVSGDTAPPQPRRGHPGSAGSIVRALKRMLPRFRRTPTERTTIARGGDFLAWLGGGDKALLEQLPEERARFAQMAGVLLTTAGIAVISMMFALHNGVNVGLPATVILGLLWGIIILNLDRFLVLSMGRTRDRRRLVLMTLPRLLLAVVLALVISTPLVLRIFASDINAQLITLQQERAKQQSILLASSPLAHEADQLATQINEDQAVLNGHLPETVTTPQLQTAQAQVTNLQATLHSDFQAEIAARETWQCQLTGSTCNGGSGLAGNGPIAQADYQEYQQALSTYNSTQSQLVQAQAAVATAQRNLRQDQATSLARYQAEARAALPGLQAQYNAAEADLRHETANANAVNNADTGLLAQLQALSEVSAKNSSLEAARLTVLALFLIIEILPITRP